MKPPGASRRVVATLRLVAMSCVASSALCAAAETPGGLYPAQVQPIFDRSCVACHGPEKKKAGLRLDSHAAVLRGGESGPVVVAGEPKKSELLRRIGLAADDDEVMPADGKPLLTPDEIRIVETWIRAGAPATGGALVPVAAPVARATAAPDYRPFFARMRELEQSLGVRLVPVSRHVTDGVVLRTASAPQLVTDDVLAALGDIAPVVVDAELAHTALTDRGLASVAKFSNLRRLDLAHTKVTSAGVAQLEPLKKLEWLNLVATQVDEAARGTLQKLPALTAVYTFETRLAATGAAAAGDRL